MQLGYRELWWAEPHGMLPPRVLIVEKEIGWHIELAPGQRGRSISWGRIFETLGDAREYLLRFGYLPWSTVAVYD
jgi:hypothetical protein